MFRSSFALVSFVSLFTLPALAVPDVLTYAGSLRRGNVDADGTFAVVVSLFDSDSAGTPLFTQSEPSLAVTAGELIVDLGADPTNPLSDDVLASGELFLSITVDGEELTPRIALTSVPFALQARFAEDADSVGGLSANDIAGLYTAGTGLAKSGTTFSLASNGVTSAEILDGSIIGVDIATAAVTSSHIANGAVTSAQLAPGAVTSSHLASGSVTSVAFANDSVGAAALAANSVQASEIDIDAVGSSEIATDAVGSSEIAPSAVGTFEIADNSVTSIDITNESVTSADLAPNAVGSSEIVDGSVTSVELGSSSVGASELQTSAVTSAKIALGAVNGSHLQNGGILVRREASACGGALTLAQTCVATASCGVFNPAPSGCTCSGAGVATCPNIDVGRLVPN